MLPAATPRAKRRPPICRHNSVRRFSSARKKHNLLAIGAKHRATLIVYPKVGYLSIPNKNQFVNKIKKEKEIFKK